MAAGAAAVLPLGYIRSENVQKQNMKSNISGRDDTPSFVDGYLLYILAHASEALSREFHRELADLGVSVAKWRILASLYPDLTLNVGELARRCIMKQPTLTRQVDRLCAAGLTERVHAEDDRRGVLVSLTRAGRAEASRYVAMAKAHEGRLLSGHSDDDVARLKAALAVFVGEG